MATGLLTLSPFEQQHLPQLMGWITSEAQCRLWGGPWFRHPFDVESFSADCHWQELPTFVLREPEGEIVAFGQYYNRLDHCHLGRLIVAPDARGRGYGQLLIQKLLAHGVEALNLEHASLFVLKDNHRARAVYEKLGFRNCAYPESAEWLDICDYMVAPVQKVLEVGT